MRYAFSLRPTAVTRRGRVCGLVTVVAFALVGLCLPSFASAAPAPAWSIAAMPYPANFAPGAVGNVGNGPAYMLTVTNVGSAETDGTAVTITAELPAGLTVVPGSEGKDQKTFEPVSCTETSQTATCTISAPVAAGDTVEVRVPVEVSSTVAEGSLLEVSARVTGGGAAGTSTTASTEISAGDAPFGFLPGAAGLYGSTTKDDGSPDVQAGSHPYQYTIGLAFPSYPATFGEIFGSGGGVKDLEVTLPRGMVVNPEATPVRCTESELVSEAHCPAAAAVGTVETTLKVFGVNNGPSTLYNMVTPEGRPAEFAFEIVGHIVVHLFGHVNSAGEYTLSADANEILAKNPVLLAQTTLWGSPSDQSHDAVRGACLQTGGTCPVERTGKAFVTMPSACSPTLTTSAIADSWRNPGAFTEPRVRRSTDLQGNPVGVEGCGALAFGPSVSASPTTARADSPTGLDFNLHVPQTEGYGELASANLKDAKVTLPPGMVVNPSSANGLAACSEAQIGRLPDEEGKLRFSEDPQSCPDASKLGTVEVSTPLLDHKLPGAIYLAAPHENPFGSLLALYLAVEDERSGIIAKLAGKIDADPQSGQLTATFAENPELPLEDVSLSFFGGEKAPLTTPTACGQFSAVSDLTPWSSPQAPDATPASAPFSVSSAPPGGGCGAESQLPNQPSFGAGTVSPAAGTYSPFVLNLGRGDGTQRIASIDTTLPAGLTGKLAGIPYCPDAALAGAAGKSGRAEQGGASCPGSSEIGSVIVGAGSGSQPYYVTGHAYLAGSYKGAPISLAIITPAVAGPFDLGNVVTRVALNVDPFSAQIHAVSDPLPTILEGIPLDVRSIALKLDRPEFTLNPTSCEPTAIGGGVTSPVGGNATVSNRFQVGGCDKLAFRPKLKIQLKGATRRSGHPALKAVVTYPNQGAYANIARAQVGLPHSEFLDQGNLNKVCKQADLRAGTCPASSIYGHAKAWTPLLDKPLQGPVYLAVGFGYKLPALVADLNGQIRILLKGRVDTTKHKGIRNTFEAVPDAPVSRFVLEMKGGKRYGLLENSENICRKRQSASVRLVGQNGDALHLQPKIANSCQKRKHPRHGGHHKRKNNVHGHRSKSSRNP